MYWRSLRTLSRACAVEHNTVANRVGAVCKPQACNTAREPCSAIQSVTDIYQFVVLYNTHRCLDLEIWRFSCRQQLELSRAHTPRDAVSYRQHLYLSCAHERKAHDQPWVWLIGVVNTKRNIFGDPCYRFEAKPSQFYSAFYSLVVFPRVWRSGCAYNSLRYSKSGDFRANNNTRLLYSLGMRAGNRGISIR